MKYSDRPDALAAGAGVHPLLLRGRRQHHAPARRCPPDDDLRAGRARGRLRASLPSTSTRPAARRRAFALVTAGPGLTNIVTAMAGAFLESRELLVLGGQVKSSDLATGGDPAARHPGDRRGRDRRTGVQVGRCGSRRRWTGARFIGSWCSQAGTGRPGPVFIEICLDVQAAPVRGGPRSPAGARAARRRRADVAGRRASSRARACCQGAASGAAARRRHLRGRPRGSPARGWHAAGAADGDDVERRRPGRRRRPPLRRPAEHLGAALGRTCCCSRPISSSRSARGSGCSRRASTGRASRRWRRSSRSTSTKPSSRKGHPRVDIAVAGRRRRASCDGLPACARRYPGVVGLARVLPRGPGCCPSRSRPTHTPRATSTRSTSSRTSRRAGRRDDVIVPCCSGGAFTVMMQAFEQKSGQVVITDKGLASMGYGLRGAIGAPLRSPGPAHGARGGRRRVRAEPAGARHRRGATTCRQDLCSSTTMAMHRSA